MKKVDHHFKLTETPFIADRILHNYKRDRSYFEHYSPKFNHEFLVSFEEKVDNMGHLIPLHALENEMTSPNEKIRTIISCYYPLLSITEALLSCVTKVSDLLKANFNFIKLREALHQGCLAEIQSICQEIVGKFELHIEKFIDKGILVMILNDFRILMKKLKAAESELEEITNKSNADADEYIIADSQLEDIVGTIIESTPAVFGEMNISKREEYSIEKIMMQAQFMRNPGQ